MIQNLVPSNQASPHTLTASGSGSQIQNANKITNTTTTNSHNTVNNNITIKFGEETLQKLCEDPGYMKRMEKAVHLGKYAVLQHMSDIYFNQAYPMNNTIEKHRINDRHVRIKTDDNEWSLRTLDDVYKTIVGCMESYMAPYFQEMEKRFGELYDTDRPKFRMMTRYIREFGHKVLWLDWSCEEIRQIGVELNEPYCENERSRRIQEMKGLMLEHMYDKTREMVSKKNVAEDGGTRGGPSGTNAPSVRPDAPSA